MRERQHLEKSISAIASIESELADHLAMIELGEEEEEESVVREAEDGLKALHDDLGRRQVAALLSGESDGNDAYLEVHAGAGGTESQDWAAMLLRMYVRWAEQNGYKVEVQYESAGEEAGIKSATILIKGENAYGWLKTESGVHRLVRISPFDSQARRHTSFSSVWVYPVIDDNIEIEIPEKDIRIDTFRSSGAGGQHVNTTDSAVRITHLPTGIVVTSSEKSQHQNRANAMKLLLSKYVALLEDQKKAELERFYGEKGSIGWGNQIRSYVLQPYRLVKDLRTGQETSNTDAVLDGALDPFVSAWLRAGCPTKRMQGIKDDDADE